MQSTYSDFDIDDCWNRIGVFSKGEKSCQRLLQFAHCQNCDQYITSGRLLLNRPLPDDYRQELSDRLRQPFSQVPKATHSAFIFRAGDEWLGVKSLLIKEVVDMGPIHSIPHKSSRIFRGIVNIRGRLELCVSIGGVLRIEPGAIRQGTPAPERLIVAAKGGQSIVFPVSEVMGPVPYNTSALRPLPITVSGSKAVYTKGILNINNKEIGMLDDAMLFRILTRNLG
jgi:chemotaxis-related protein WspD